MKVEFYKHNIGAAEAKLLLGVLRSRFLTTGVQTKRFEEEFAAYLGTRYCVGVTSWTMGAFITLKALGVGPGDEVITCPMTFISTPNVVLYCGATPVFVDAELETGNIDTSKIEAAITSRTRAILPVHLYGHMADMLTISAIAKRHGLLVVEDCAHCVEGQRDGVRPGQLSDAAVFSFYATKNITCGEGGAVVTNRADLDEALRKYRLHGMSAGAADRYSAGYRHWDMELLGYKCNMFDIQAALLLGQLRKIEGYRDRKEARARLYERALRTVPGVRLPRVLPKTKHAWHVYPIWVPPERRDAWLAGLRDMGIGVGVHFRAVPTLRFYRETFGYRRGQFPVAEQLGDTTLSLPLYPKLTRREIGYVAQAVKALAHGGEATA